MTDDPVVRNQTRHVREALEALQQPGGQYFWDVYDELSGLPASYDVTVDQFREGLRSPHQYIMAVSAENVARFAKDSEWALPELEDLLKRAEHDVFLVSAAANAIQNLGTREAAAVLAGALDRALESDIPISQKGELATYILRSLVAMGLVAHEQRGAFRRAIEYFAGREERVWTPECLWELEMFCAENSGDLHQLLQRDPTAPLTDEVLIGYRVRTLPSVKERAFGDWGVVMDDYCKFSSCGLPDRFAFLRDASYADDHKGRNLGLARVVIFENTSGVRAVCLACDEAGVGPVTWYPEVAASMLHRTIKLDPCSTYILSYHMNDAGEGIRGNLAVIEGPGYNVSSASDVFGEALPDIQKMLFEGTKLSDSTLAAAQVLRRVLSKE